MKPSKPAAQMSVAELAAYIDHSVLKPDFTPDEVRREVEAAVAFGCRTACINPASIEIAAPLCEGTDTGICVVVDFPFGCSSTESKVAQTKVALEAGIQELDIVANYGWIRGGELKRVEDDLRAVIDLCHEQGVLVKVIFETDALTLGRIEDGRLYGRGACDTKASLAAMLVAVGTLGRSGGSLPTGVHLATVVDEEVEYRGVSVLAGAISAGRLRVDAAVVGEPTELHRVVAHKGCVRFHIEVRGMSGHSSEPAKGINAIQSMAEVLSFLRNEIEPGYEALRHAWVGPPTHCVSEIVGGDAPNTIPGFCRVTVDRRTVPGEDPLAVRAALEERLHGLARRTPGLSLTVGKPFIVDYAMEVDPRAPIVRRLEAATEKFASGKRNLGAAYGTDASKLARVGVPTVVFGPGSIAQAHTGDEWVSLAETRTAAATLLDLIVHYREDEET